MKTFEFTDFDRIKYIFEYKYSLTDDITMRVVSPDGSEVVSTLKGAAILAFVVDFIRNEKATALERSHKEELDALKKKGSYQVLGLPDNYGMR